MDFSKALIHIKRFNNVRRSGWNGKGMFLLRIDSCFLSYPNEMDASFADFIAIHATDGKLYPWFLSQQDLLANDWEVVINEVH